MNNLLNSPLLKEICKQNGIEYLALFGSYARGEESTKSDIDLLVRFGQPVGYFKLVQVQRKLGEFLGNNVDLVTEGALSTRIFPYVQKDLKTIYES